MKQKLAKQTGLLLVPLFLITFLMAGCAVKKSIWGDPQSGLILNYRFPEDRVFQYQTSGEQIQKVEIMGQARETVSKSSMKFSVKTKGKKENNVLLGIMVDDMKIDVSSGMTGDLSPDLGSIIGKSFDLNLSPLGKELGFSGTESLKYSMGFGGDRNIESSFKTLFPDLSDKPVKIGETWTTKSDITEEAGGLSVRVVTETVNTLKGLETVNGLECVKIEAKTTGTMSGEGQQMGADLTLKAEIKSSSTWYFAYKMGVFVKQTANTVSEGSVEVSAQNMTLPMKTKSGSEISLLN